MKTLTCALPDKKSLFRPCRQMILGLSVLAAIIGLSLPGSLLADEASRKPAATETSAETESTDDANNEAQPTDQQADSSSSEQDSTQTAGVFRRVEKKIDELAGTLVGWLAAVIFFDVCFFTDAANIPLAVLWLVLGAIFFTVRMGFINIRAFKHAIEVTMGRYDRPEEDAGEVTHFRH